MIEHGNELSENGINPIKPRQNFNYIGAWVGVLLS